MMMKLIGVSLVATAFLLGSMAGYATPAQAEFGVKTQEKTKEADRIGTLNSKKERQASSSIRFEY